MWGIIFNGFARVIDNTDHQPFDIVSFFLNGFYTRVHFSEFKNYFQAIFVTISI